MGQTHDAGRPLREARERAGLSPTDGYEDLSRGALHFEVFGVDVQAARLEDIVRSKHVADRPQDRQDVVVMHETLRRRATVNGE